MIPIEIDMKNFLAYGSPGPLDLEGIDVAVLTGENGAGKSSVLDAITWALWGKARAPVDELIREGTHDMSVAFRFDSDVDISNRIRLQRYLVLRKRKENSRSILDLQILDGDTWRSLAGSNMRETQDIITGIVGLDYETFINASMILQGRIDEFTSKKAAQRKQVLADILMLGQWEAYEELAKLNVRGAQGKLETLETQIKLASDQVNANKQLDVDLSVAQADAKSKASLLEAGESTYRAQQDVWTAIATAKERAKDLEDNVKLISQDLQKAEIEFNLYQRLPEASELVSQITGWQSKLEDTTESAGRMDKIGEMISVLSEQVAGLESANTLMKVQISDAQSTVDVLNSLDEPHCPTCKQLLDPEEQESVIQDILASMTISNNEVAMNLETVLEKRKEISRLRGESDELQTQLGDVQHAEKQIIKVEAEIVALDEKIATRERVAGRLAELKGRMDLARQDAREATEAVEALEADVPVDRITDADIQRLKREHEAAHSHVGALQNQLELLDETKKQLDAWRAEEMDLADDVGVLKEVRVAFSKKGVPAMLIEQAVPEIERSANDLLLRLTDGRMHVRFDTQRQLKSGDMAEALEIVISDELGARSYENYSGGEKFKINFAIRIALSKLLARRAGVQLRSLFIDEGFGTQDASGREQVVASINAIKEDFDCIIVITHIEELKEAFPVQIEVIKSASGSTFRTIR